MLSDFRITVLNCGPNAQIVDTCIHTHLCLFTIAFLLGLVAHFSNLIRTLTVNCKCALLLCKLKINLNRYLDMRVSQASSPMSNNNRVRSRT